MIKKLIIFLAVIAALFSIPATRSRMVLFSQPVLEKLGPFGQKLLLPAHKYQARTSATMYLRLIAEGYNEGREPPSPRDFTRWIKSKTAADGLDPWGGRYWLRRDRGTLTVGSNGPDGERGTPDDLTQTVPF